MSRVVIDNGEGFEREENLMNKRNSLKTNPPNDFYR